MPNSPENHSQFIIYQTENGDTKLDVRFQNETVWLTQKHMASLFQTSIDNISLHLKNIYQEGELDQKATTEDYSTVRQEGNRQDIRKKTSLKIFRIRTQSNYGKKTH